MVQGNLQHGKDATTNLIQHLISGKSDIALIQEPHVHNNKVIGLKTSIGTVFAGTRVLNPRTCIFVNKKYHAILVPELSNRDLTVIYLERKIKGVDHPVMVASAYLPYDHPDRREHCTTEVKRLIERCKTDNIQLILGMDANAHHIVWGSTDINQRGESLLDYLSSTDLYLLNRGNEPTFVTANRREVIDITLSSKDLPTQVRGWQVSKELSASDHRWIRFKLIADEVKPKLYRDPRKTDWEKFLESLNENLNFDGKEPRTREEVETALGHLKSNLLNS